MEFLQAVINHLIFQKNLQKTKDFLLLRMELQTMEYSVIRQSQPQKQILLQLPGEELLVFRFTASTNTARS